MEPTEACPQCGSPLPADTPEGGLCPRCLLELGLAGSPGNDEEIYSESRETSPGPALESTEFIGPYRILDLLGEGGMGLVYLAEQTEPVRRRVALKVIKLGMDSHDVIARFEAERQALALMNHPNVAKVFDAGAAEDGRPYFVMEYVPGIPITEYCDLRCLSVPERLELFIQVCEAIQHAHQKGIIHRDVKPTNVLVGTEEGEVSLKVIDFGVAKATGGRLTERSLYTQRGVLVGTPEYMSPEQAGTTALEVDTRTDIYSLGVLLYELLVGALPFDPETLRRAAAAEMLRIIREEEPPKPATKLTSLGETGREVAKRRHTDLRSLVRQLHGELEWITMRALEKDPGRRYASASEFAADVRRHLQDEPVLAGPPSLTYRLGKLARRHRAALGAAIAVLLALSVGLALSTFLYFREQSARAGEAEQRAAAEWQSYVANISAADAHVRSNESVPAIRRLQACPSDLRGWEWGHLAYRADASIARFDVGTPVASAALHADGSRILWISEEDGRLMATDLEGRTTTVHGDRSGSGGEELERPGYTVALSPDARRAARMGAGPTEFCVGGPEGSTSLHAVFPEGIEKDVLEILDLASGRRLARLVTPSSGVAAVSMQQDRICRFGLDEGGAVGMPVPHTVCRKVAAGETRGPAFVRDPEEGFLARRSWPNVISASFSPDGSRVATWSWDNIIRVWDVESGKEVVDLPGHEDGVTSVCFWTDSRLLVSGSYDRTVRIWDSDAASQDDDPSAHILPSGRIGEQLVESLRRIKSFQRLDPQKAIGNFEPHQGAVLAVAISPDGNQIASGSEDTFVSLIEPRCGKGFLRGHTDVVTALAFSPDGRQLLSGSRDRTLRIWEARAGDEHTYHFGRLLGVAMGHTGEITSVGFGPGEDRFFSTGRDGTIRLWDSRFHGILAPVEGGPDGIWLLGLSPDCEHYVASAASGAWEVRLMGESFPDRLAVRELETGKALTTLELEEAVRGASAAAFSPDGERIAAGLGDGTIRVWDVSSGERLLTLTGHEDNVISVAFSPDGSRILSGSDDATARSWDAKSGRPIRTFQGSGDQVFSVSFSHDGHRILAPSNDGKLHVWDAASGKSLLTLHQFVNSAIFSPDGRRILAGLSDEPAVSVWDAMSGEQIASLVGHEHEVDSLAFSPDGKRIATGSSKLRVWDEATYQLLLTLESQEDPVYSLAFCTDGRRIVSGHTDGTIRIWKSKPLQ